MPFEINELLQSFLGELKAIASTKSIIGEPIEIDGKTIIPVIKLKLGLGGGGGSEESGKGQGGGVGGGITVEPVAFIVVKDDDVSIMGTKGAKFEKLVQLVPGLIEKIKAAKEKKAKSEETEEFAEE